MNDKIYSIFKDKRLISHVYSIRSISISDCFNVKNKQVVVIREYVHVILNSFERKSSN